MRLDARVPELQRVADRPSRRAPRALPLLQLRDAAAEGVRASAAGTYHRAGRGSGPSASRRRSARDFPRRASRASIATRSGGAARSRRCSTRFAAGELDVLVGTQMIAKGHDFPQRHAGRRHLRRRRSGPRRLPRRRADVPAADAGGRPRRARRDPRRGDRADALPDHYSIRHACRQDYAAFYDEEIDFRQAMRYPPAVALVNAVVKASTLRGRDAATPATLVAGAAHRAATSFRVLGPGAGAAQPAEGGTPGAVLPQGHAARRRCARRCWRRSAARPEIARRTIVDVDPMSVL